MNEIKIYKQASIKISLVLFLSLALGLIKNDLLIAQEALPLNINSEAIKATLNKGGKLAIPHGSNIENVMISFLDAALMLVSSQAAKTYLKDYRYASKICYYALIIAAYHFFVLGCLHITLMFQGSPPFVIDKEGISYGEHIKIHWKDSNFFVKQEIGSSIMDIVIHLLPFADKNSLIIRDKNTLQTVYLEEDKMPIRVENLALLIDHLRTTSLLKTKE